MVRFFLFIVVWSLRAALGSRGSVALENLALRQQLATIAPPPPELPQQDSPAASAEQPPCTHRSQYRPWAELLKRTFTSDLEKCSRCGGRLKLRALVKRPASIQRYLRHLGESTDAPPLAPARDPPYFRSRALRRKLGELEEQPSQVELFGS